MVFQNVRIYFCAKRSFGAGLPLLAGQSSSLSRALRSSSAHLAKSSFRSMSSAQSKISTLSWFSRFSLFCSLGVIFPPVFSITRRVVFCNYPAWPSQSTLPTPLRLGVSVVQRGCSANPLVKVRIPSGSLCIIFSITDFPWFCNFL